MRESNRAAPTEERKEKKKENNGRDSNSKNDNCGAVARGIGGGLWSSGTTYTHSHTEERKEEEGPFLVLTIFCKYLTAVTKRKKT